MTPVACRLTKLSTMWLFASGVVLLCACAGEEPRLFRDVNAASSDGHQGDGERGDQGDESDGDQDDQDHGDHAQPCTPGGRDDDRDSDGYTPN